MSEDFSKGKRGAVVKQICPTKMTKKRTICPTKLDVSDKNLTKSHDMSDDKVSDKNENKMQDMSDRTQLHI